MKFFRDKLAAQGPRDGAVPAAPLARSGERAAPRPDDAAAEPVSKPSARSAARGGRGGPVLDDPPYQDPFAARARMKSYPARGPVRRRIWDIEDEPAAQESALGIAERQTSGSPQDTHLPSDMSDGFSDHVGPDPFVTADADRPIAGQPASPEQIVAEARAQIARATAAESAAAAAGRQGEAAASGPADASGPGMSASGGAASAPTRGTARTKTRLLGFQARELAARDPFAQGGLAEAADASGPRFPVGWIVVTEGPGRGASFALQSGVSSVGRGEDQVVRLDFGDTSISRQNHASVAFDDEAQRFFLGHGGKSNLVRLNGRPVLSTEDLSDGDVIRIGETTLRFIALCKDGFVWGDASDGERSGRDDEGNGEARVANAQHLHGGHGDA